MHYFTGAEVDGSQAIRARSSIAKDTDTNEIMEGQLLRLHLTQRASSSLAPSQRST